MKETIVTGYINKDTLITHMNSNGVFTIKLPTIYVNKEPLIELIGENNIVKIDMIISREEI